MASLHGAAGRSLLLYALCLAGWGVVEAVRGRLSQAYLVALGLCEALLLLAALAGLVLRGRGDTQAQAGLHTLYSVVALTLIPVALASARAGTPRVRALTLAVAMGLLVLVSGRLLATGLS